MAKPKTDPVELTYPLRTAARLTGLSPELLRAWERRYGVVEPLRTAGGRAVEVDIPENVERVASLEDLEQRVALLAFERSNAR